jgi:uncharacterized metal-binding protein
MNCSRCGLWGCRGPGGKYPEECPTAHPTEEQARALTEAKQRYADPQVRSLARAAAYIEKAGYCRWTRLEETVEFARQMGYGHLGIASCVGLRREARVVAGYFEDCGFRVSVAICKAGCVPKDDIEVPDRAQFRPGSKESMCNSVGQAYLLAGEGCQLNVVMGLCVGHDTLFLEHSFRKGVPATVLVAKDRVTGHNPAAAIYGAEGYFQARLASHHKGEPQAGGA